jgi:hypothetical protein
MFIALLSSIGYPLLDKGSSVRDEVSRLRISYCNTSLDCLRVACDLMVLFFIYDEFTDNVDGDGARAYADLVVDVLRNPHAERPQGESKLAEITRQYVCSGYPFKKTKMSDIFLVSSDSGIARSKSRANPPSAASSNPSPDMSTQ